MDSIQVTSDDQPGFDVYQSELEFVLNFYGSDFNDELLKTNYKCLANFADKSASLTS